MNKATKQSVWVLPDELKQLEQAAQAKELAVQQEAASKSLLKRKAGEGEPDDAPEANVVEKKPKKAKKPKVVQSLAEIEDVDLKTELAQQLAEAVGAAGTSLAPSSSREELAANLSSEETVAAYKAMLEEKDINAMAPWDSELPKFVNDPRYKCLSAFLKHFVWECLEGSLAKQY